MLASFVCHGKVEMAPAENRGHFGVCSSDWSVRLCELFHKRETTMSAEPRLCHRCGHEIPPQRLRVLPDTRLCLDCSQEIGGDFETYVIPENTGKPGSLKKNYGSWKVKRKLRQDRKSTRLN